MLYPILSILTVIFCAFLIWRTLPLWSQSTRSFRWMSWSFAFVVSMLVPMSTHLYAQVTGAPAPSAVESILMSIIPFLIPMLVALIKKIAPVFFSNPKWKFLLPVAAALFGIALQWMGSLASGVPTDTIKGVLLGGAGVLIREIYDQLDKARKAIAPATA